MRIMLLFMALPALVLAHPTSFSLQENGTPGLLSNGATDIVYSVNETGDTLVWVATGEGVSRTADYGASWITYTSDDGIGRGGVSALAAGGPWVCVATVYDTTVGIVGAGGGVSITSDQGANWFWMPQPVDDPGDTTLAWIDTPTTVAIDNITYHMSVNTEDSTLWIATYAGGFRRYTFADSTWENIPPDEVPFGSYENVNHRGFSALSYGTRLWAGSAGGLNLSTDRGATWENFQFQNTQLNGEPQITGNWVVGLDTRPVPGREMPEVWVGGWATFAEVGDYYGVAFTRDEGASWQIVHDLDHEKVYNFAFDGDDIYVATDTGLYKSNQAGAAGSWDLFPQITDSNNGRTIWLDQVYGVAVINSVLFVGTSEGIAVSGNGGSDWQVAIRDPINLKMYPSPFSPALFERARLSFDLSASATISVDMFDFAMEKVKTICVDQTFSAGENWELYWDGSDLQGKRVATGVYFYRFRKNDDDPVWGKILVIK